MHTSSVLKLYKSRLKPRLCISLVREDSSKAVVCYTFLFSLDDTRKHNADFLFPGFLRLPTQGI